MPTSRISVSSSGVEEARTLFAKAGLELPPIPASLAPKFRLLSAWTFASKPLRVWPYNMHTYVEAALSRKPRPYVLLAHAGHGINSYALHYYLVQRHLRLFLQIGWGGVYMDEAEAAAEVNECFRLCHELVASVDEAETKRALRLQASVPVVASTFNRSGNAYPPESLGMNSWPASLEYDRESGDLTPQLVLSEATRWFRSLVAG